MSQKVLSRSRLPTAFGNRTALTRRVKRPTGRAGALLYIDFGVATANPQQFGHPKGAAIETPYADGSEIGWIFAAHSTRG